MHVRADQWASYCLTWTPSNGLRLFVNGIDLQLAAPRPIPWFRNFTALACRITVCRYASDVSTEFRVAGFYDYGEVPFSDVFYIPASLDADELPSVIGLSGACAVPVLLHFTSFECT